MVLNNISTELSEMVGIENNAICIVITCAQWYWALVMTNDYTNTTFWLF